MEPFEATQDDLWSFLFDPATERENVVFAFFHRDHFEDDALLEYGPFEELDLPWSEARKTEIEEGAKPDESELQQWRLALCRYRLQNDQVDMSATIVPIKRAGENTGAFAVWVDFVELDPSGEMPPTFHGVFDSVDEATAALRAEGHVLV